MESLAFKLSTTFGPEIMERLRRISREKELEAAKQKTLEFALREAEPCPVCGHQGFRTFSENGNAYNAPDTGLRCPGAGCGMQIPCRGYGSVEDYLKTLAAYNEGVRRQRARLQEKC